MYKKTILLEEVESLVNKREAALQAALLALNPMTHSAEEYKASAVKIRGGIEEIRAIRRELEKYGRQYTTTG